MNNGMPLGVGPQPVPDLAALRNGQAMQDIPTQVQQMILGAAGITPGGRALVDLDRGSVTLTDPMPMVLFSPAGIDIVGITGVDTGTKHFIPWHAVRGLQAVS